MRPTPAAIALHQLSVSHRRHAAVQSLSGEFAIGSLTAIVGPNGAGKTSLLAALMGRVPVTGGSVTFHERVRGRIAWLPQQAELDRSFPLRVVDVVALGHWSRLGSFRGMTREQHAQVEQALDTVGLAAYAQRSIAALSSGQFQRVLFARLLVQDAPVILLDEPFNALDARTTRDLLAVVARWHAEGRTVIAVLHDLDQVRAHFPQTLLLARHGVAWGPTGMVLQPGHLQRAQALAEAWGEDEADGPPGDLAGSMAGEALDGLRDHKGDHERHHRAAA